MILKNGLAAIRKSGRNDEAIAAAQKLLDELPGEVNTAVRNKYDVSACDVGRLRVLDAIESLRK